MKDELIELLELLIDIAMTSDKTNSIETETLCQSTQFTQESQPKNNGHQAYVTNLNNLIKGSDYAGLTLEAIIKKAPAGGVFNNAAQVWNHTFFWHSMKSRGGGSPAGALAEAIHKKWGSFDEFKKAFQSAAVGNFGSGWTWLVKKADGSVDILNTSGAGTPIAGADKPLLAIDVWEHAYYIDYRNQRPKFVETFLANLANWEFAAKNFS